MSKHKDAFGVQPTEKLRSLLKAAEKGSLPDVASLLQNVEVSGEGSYLDQQELTVDSCDDEGLTALHIASANGHEGIVRFLLIRGASLDIACSHGWSPLMFAAYYGHHDIVDLLRQSKANINATNLMGATPLTCACRCGHSKIAQTLLENGAQTEMNGKSFNPYATSALITAAQHGHLEAVQVLIEFGADVNFQHPVTGWNAIMMASLNGHLDVVKILVDKGGADVNLLNNADQTALSVASLNSRRDVERYLAKRTSRKLESKVYKPSRPPIIEAAIEGNYEKVNEILKANEKEVNAQDGDGATALIYASMKGHLEIVDLLIRKNADINVQDKVTEWTALMQATCNGHIDCINLLLKADADIDIKNSKTLTVFDLATTVGNPEIIRILARKALENGTGLTVESIKNYANDDGNSENKGSVVSWISKMVSGKMQPWKTSRSSFPTSRVPPQPPDSLSNSLINENSDPLALVDTYSLKSSSSILSVLDANRSPREKPKIALVFPQTKLPDEVLAPVLSPFPRRTSFELPRMPKDAKLSSSDVTDISPQSSSSETSSLLKQSGNGRLTSRGQISMQFVADSPDSPLSSMTSSNSFFTSVSRQKGRPVMPSVNGLRRPRKAFLPDTSSTTYTQPLRSRNLKQHANNTGSLASVNTSHSAPVQPSLAPRPPSKPRSRSSFPTIVPRSDTSFIAGNNDNGYHENDVPRMLERLSLEKYVTKFEEEEIDMEAFLAMNDSDLQSLGIKETTHRRQILEAIRELKDRSQSFSQHSKFNHFKKERLSLGFN